MQSSKLSPLARLAALASVSGLALVPNATLAVPAGGYADLIEEVSPGVVFIEVEQDAVQAMEFPGGMDREEFMRRFGDRFGRDFDELFPEEGQGRSARSLGTGFIISEEGLLVTNNHVVEGASEITITLEDGSTYAAEVVGTDPLTDVALLEITDGDGFTVLDFGDSDEMRRGDDVMAIGNPFGLGGTVTTGIVSALARDINSGPYDEFIQTDAAINRGNSGGPLFNDDGEVIGMNTAIFSRDGGSNGIGFAVPSNLIERVVADLADDGTIERGWLGVRIGTMSDEIAAVLGYDEPVGAVVEAVTPDSPAQDAGFLAGDIILQVNETELEDPQALQRAIADYDPGSDVAVTVFRKGREMTIDVTLGTLPISNT